MIVAYEGGLLITKTNGPQRATLLVDSRTGKILPPSASPRIQQRVNVEGLALYQGLRNAHEHLDKNHYPRSKWRDTYDNASQWATDFSPRLAHAPYEALRNWPAWERYWVGVMKNLLSGVTTVIQHDAPHRILNRAGITIEGWRGAVHSLYLTPPETIQRAYRKSPRLYIHLAEGTDSAAADELDQLEALGCLGPKTVLIHGVGIRDTERAARLCGGLVWCPSSNQFLLGKTAQVKAWYAAGKLALGSDSRLTAEGDLLDELRAAHATGQLNPQALFDLVTDSPLSDADFFALPESADGDYYGALIRARRGDILWVMKRGKLLWRRDENHPNCLMNGLTYQLERSLYQILKRSRYIPLDGGLLRLDNYPMIPIEE